MKITGAPAARALRVTVLMRSIVPAQSKAAPSPSQRPCWTSMTRTAVVMVGSSWHGDDNGRFIDGDGYALARSQSAAAGGKADHLQISCQGDDDLVARRAARDAGDRAGQPVAARSPG